uniref:Transmembrane protein 186 n=1 Tax=Timema tahoe TaxID=61484 RepID=A0A7R9IPC6_9NEOP|nr:unnamed protein product [Timema tahoe]
MLFSFMSIRVEDLVVLNVAAMVAWGSIFQSVRRKSLSSTSYLRLRLFSCVTLYTLGIVCNRIVGAIYVTPDAKTVKFSYLDFWGRRNDIICPVTDVLPLSELEGRVTDPYIDLRQYSTPKKLRFSIRYGSIVDADNFKKVFGNIEE